MVGVRNYYNNGANSVNAVSPFQLTVDAVASYTGIYGGWPGALASGVYFFASPYIWSSPKYFTSMQLPVPYTDATYVVPPVIRK